MSRYPALVEALQRRRTVVKADLVRLDFGSGTFWVWTGAGPLRTADGQVWQGLGQLGSISPIERALVPGGDEPTLTLSGVDPVLIPKVRNASADVKGRPARIFEQYFDPDTMAPIDIPVVLFAGLMDRMQIKAEGPAKRTITVTLLTLLANRRRPAFAYLSDADQRALHPGDRGAEQIPALVQADPTWPNY